MMARGHVPAMTAVTTWSIGILFHPDRPCSDPGPRTMLLLGALVVLMENPVPLVGD